MRRRYGDYMAGQADIRVVRLLGRPLLRPPQPRPVLHAGPDGGSDGVPMTAATKARPPTCVDCNKLLNPKSNRSTLRCRYCMLLSHSTMFKPYEMDDGFGHYLAGLTDGEGNFHSKKNKGIPGGFAFRIILREDDLPILQEIQQHLGIGVLYYRDVLTNIVNWNPRWQSSVRRNQWAYLIQSSVDLVRVVVPHFDRYPLRAKKRFQYEEWRCQLLRQYFHLGF